MERYIQVGEAGPTADRPGHPVFAKVPDPYVEISRLRNELDGEREARAKLDKALRQKDEAMGVLFERLAKAGVDCSDLFS